MKEVFREKKKNIIINTAQKKKIKEPYLKKIN